MPKGYKDIEPGDTVTIRTPQGQTRRGRVVMKGPAGWVLNLGGRHGTPGIASPENTVKVTKSKKSRNQNPLARRIGSVSPRVASIARRVAAEGILKQHRAIAEKWVGEPCTLNGKPATVNGRKLRFPVVAADDGESYEWSWEAVDRIMKKDGKFSSRDEAKGKRTRKRKGGLTAPGKRDGTGPAKGSQRRQQGLKGRRKQRGEPCVTCEQVKKAGREYERVEWLEFLTGADDLPRDVKQLQKKFEARIEELMVEHVPQFQEDAPDQEEIYRTAYLSFASLVGHGVGLWEGDEDWHEDFEKVVERDSKAKSLGQDIEMETAGLGED